LRKLIKENTAGKEQSEHEAQEYHVDDDQCIESLMTILTLLFVAEMFVVEITTGLVS